MKKGGAFYEIFLKRMTSKQQIFTWKFSVKSQNFAQTNFWQYFYIYFFIVNRFLIEEFLSWRFIECYKNHINGN